MTKDELIEEIGLFGKLDVKWILEELIKRNSYKIASSKEIIALDNEVLELIKNSLLVLIEMDEKFALLFEQALKEVDKKNKVSNIDIADYNINEKNLYLLYFLLKYQPIHTINSFQNFSKISNLIKENKKEDKDIGTISTSSGINMFSKEYGVTIGGDNSGDIITGNNNTINNTIIVKEEEVNLEERLKESLGKLYIGKMIFNTPKNIFSNEAKEVVLRISKNKISTDDLPEDNQQIKQNIEILSTMKAKLHSMDFDIMAISEEEQVIRDLSFTEWKWLIYPKIKKDKGKVYLRITIRIPLSFEKEEKIDLPIFEKKIDILVK